MRHFTQYHHANQKPLIIFAIQREKLTPPRWRFPVTVVKDWRHRGGVSKNTIRQHTVTSATAPRRDFIN